MKTKFDFDAVLERATAGDYCDSGHYHCPQVTPKGIVFPAGIVRRNGTFSGATRLAEMLTASLAAPVGGLTSGDVGPKPDDCPWDGQYRR